jgi:hypothetical protein
VKLFCDGGSSDPLTTFENQRGKTGARQVTGGDQAIVPASDDDHVMRARH